MKAFILCFLSLALLAEVPPQENPAPAPPESLSSIKEQVEKSQEKERKEILKTRRKIRKEQKQKKKLQNPE